MLNSEITELLYENEKIERKEKVECWIEEVENKHIKDYCSLLTELPSENSIIVENTKVSRYEEPIPITTDINPYPGYTSIYEVGTIESIGLKELEEKKEKIRLYRIEVNQDPTIYIEYISSKKEKFWNSLYIVKDNNENNFLIYPLTSEVNERYYINISLTVYE